MIRLAMLTDLDNLLMIKDLVIADMAKHNIFQWDHTYPNLDILRQDIENGDLYVIEENGTVCGFACIDTKQASEYATLDWHSPKEAYVIHRLAIHPDFGGKGYASMMIKFSESLALANNIRDLRIDTFCHNHRAQALFKKSGFEYIGDIFFARKDEPFCCFHKSL